MRMKKLWIFVAILVVACGSWAVLYRTDLLPEQKAMVSKFIRDIMPVRGKGLIRGIVSSEDSFTALIDTQAVREGDTIHGVNVVKIYVDKIEFEKDGRQWIQELNEAPGRQWRESVEVMAKKQVDAKPIEEAKAQAETETKAQAEAETKAQAQAKTKEEAEAKAKAEESRIKAEADARAKAEADAKAKEEAEAIAKAEEAEAKAQAEAEARAKADEEAKAKAEADRRRHKIKMMEENIRKIELRKKAKAKKEKDKAAKGRKR